GERQAATIGPVDALYLAQQLCDDGLMLYSNAHRFWNDPGVMQGIWDLRDSFKSTGRMLVLLRSVVNFTVFLQKWPKFRHSSPKCCISRSIFTSVASALQGF